MFDRACRDATISTEAFDDGSADVVLSGQFPFDQLLAMYVQASMEEFEAEPANQD